jgi:catechol 2,3-dioxygenase-like lactoylglutathione lyase family enzyme
VTGLSDVIETYMNLKFDCIFYYVSDLEAAVRFYVDILGFQLISRDIVARFDVDGVLFELVPTGEEDKLSGKGNARLCLKTDNIDQAAADLGSKGISVSDPEDVEKGRVSSFLDLDGNEICLWQYL